MDDFSLIFDDLFKSEQETRSRAEAMIQEMAANDFPALFQSLANFVFDQSKEKYHYLAIIIINSEFIKCSLPEAMNQQILEFDLRILHEEQFPLKYKEYIIDKFQKFTINMTSNQQVLRVWTNLLISMEQFTYSTLNNNVNIYLGSIFFSFITIILPNVEILQNIYNYFLKIDLQSIDMNIACKIMIFFMNYSSTHEEVGSFENLSALLAAVDEQQFIDLVDAYINILGRTESDERKIQISIQICEKCFEKLNDEGFTRKNYIVSVISQLFDNFQHIRDFILNNLQDCSISILNLMAGITVENYETLEPEIVDFFQLLSNFESDTKESNIQEILQGLIGHFQNDYVSSLLARFIYINEETISLFEALFEYLGSEDDILYTNAAHSLLDIEQHQFMNIPGAIYSNCVESLLSSYASTQRDLIPELIFKFIQSTKLTDFMQNISEFYDETSNVWFLFALFVSSSEFDANDLHNYIHSLFDIIFSKFAPNIISCALECLGLIYCDISEDPEAIQMLGEALEQIHNNFDYLVTYPSFPSLLKYSNLDSQGLHEFILLMISKIPEIEINFKTYETTLSSDCYEFTYQDKPAYCANEDLEAIEHVLDTLSETLESLVGKIEIVTYESMLNCVFNLLDKYDSQFYSLHDYIFQIILEIYSQMNGNLQLFIIIANKLMNVTCALQSYFINRSSLIYSFSEIEEIWDNEEYLKLYFELILHDIRGILAYEENLIKSNYAQTYQESKENGENVLIYANIFASFIETDFRSLAIESAVNSLEITFPVDHQLPPLKNIFTMIFWSHAIIHIEEYRNYHQQMFGYLAAILENGSDEQKIASINALEYLINNLGFSLQDLQNYFNVFFTMASNDDVLVEQVLLSTMRIMLKYSDVNLINAYLEVFLKLGSDETIERNPEINDFVRHVYELIPSNPILARFHDYLAQFINQAQDEEEAENEVV